MLDLGMRPKDINSLFAVTQKQAKGGEASNEMGLEIHKNHAQAT